MQIKRLRKVLLSRGIKISNYYIDGTGKTFKSELAVNEAVKYITE